VSWRILGIVFAVACPLISPSRSVAQDSLLIALAEKLCGVGASQTLQAELASLLPDGEEGYAVARVARDGNNQRFLYGRSDVCKNGRLTQRSDLNLVFANFEDKNVGIYFVADPIGDLLKAIEVTRGPAPVYKTVDRTPAMKSKFGIECGFWAAKFNVK